MTLNQRCFCHPEKNRVHFTGYPSNHFSGCRLNGWLLQTNKPSDDGVPSDDRVGFVVIIKGFKVVTVVVVAGAQDGCSIVPVEQHSISHSLPAPSHIHFAQTAFCLQLNWGFESVQYLEAQSPPSKQEAEVLSIRSHTPFPQQSCWDRQTMESIFPSF